MWSLHWMHLAYDHTDVYLPTNKHSMTNGRPQLTSVYVYILWNRKVHQDSTSTNEEKVLQIRLCYEQELCHSFIQCHWDVRRLLKWCFVSEIRKTFKIPLLRLGILKINTEIWALGTDYILLAIVMYDTIWKFFKIEPFVLFQQNCKKKNVSKKNKPFY